MNKTLEQLAKTARTLEAFIETIVRFPHFYLRTDDEKRMTKKDFREFYLARQGVSK